MYQNKNTMLNFTTKELQPFNEGNKEFPYETNIVYLITKCSEACLGLVGNILTITAVIIYKKLHTGSNMLILSLALSDTISLIMPLIATIENIFKYYQVLDVAPVICYLAIFLGLIGGLSNAHGICLMAFDRFLAVKFPIFYRNKMKTKTWIKVLSIQWIYMLAKVIIECIFAAHVEVDILCALEYVFDLKVYTYGYIFYFVLISCVTTGLYIQVVHLVSYRSLSKHLKVYSFLNKCLQLCNNVNNSSTTQ